MVLDSDAKNVHVGRRKGFPIYYGSPDREEVLEAVGMKRAVSVIVTIPDREEAVKTVRRIHEMYPNTPIIARGWDRSHVKALEEAGANVAIAEAFEVSMQMGVTILRAVGVADLEIERIIQSFRNEGYDMQLGENAIANVEPSGNSSTS
jgi:voltage-gated potassium channel Kch